VTVNTSNAVLYADTTFASTNQPWVSGNNTYTAIAHDVYGRISTNGITVALQTTNGFTYDLNGNLLSDGTRNFKYDDENQLISVWVANNWSNNFVYDGKMRRRIERDYSWAGSFWAETNEVRFIYDGNVVVQERDANNLPKVTYTRGNDLSGTLQGAGGIGGLLARSDNTQMIIGSSSAHAYYHADGNGNVTMLINNLQLVEAKYLYDPFGNTLSLSGPLAGVNAYRFSSKEWNASSGMYYYLYRFYDPNLQRWLNRDPIQEVGGWNLYDFVQNKPIMNYDALGWVSLYTCEEAIRRAVDAHLKWNKDKSEINWFNYLVAQEIANDSCGPPGPPTYCPGPYRKPPKLKLPPPPQLEKVCVWTMVGGVLLYVCRIVIILAPAGA